MHGLEFIGKPLKILELSSSSCRFNLFELVFFVEVFSTEEGLLPEVDDRIKEKLRVFREKSERNMAAIPNKLKRLKECIRKIDEIGQVSVNVHPILKMEL